MYTMSVYVLWIIFLNWIATTGQAFSDVDSCTTNGDRYLTLFEDEFCLATKDDVNMGCPPTKIPVLATMKFGVKRNFDVCIKRILSAEVSFCCKAKVSDTLYDGNCLLDIWSKEDTDHYRKFIQETIVKCKDTSNCVLTSNMFRSLQKEIPTTGLYASYIQLIYHCISAPTNSIKVCSSKSTTGREIHLLSSKSSTRTGNQTCTCSLTSHQSNSRVIVRAIDVRTTKSSLILKSDYDGKDLSNQNLPINGFKEMISGQNIQISTRIGLASDEDDIWLHISGSDGQDVDVVCEAPVSDSRKVQPDTTTQRKSLPSPTGRVSTTKKKKKSEGYWPVIYLAAGSGITLVLVACIICSLLICRYSLKKPKRRYENPYNQSQVNYNRSGQYDTVPDGMPNIPDPMTASIQDPYEWPHAFVK